MLICQHRLENDGAPSKVYAPDLKLFKQVQLTADNGVAYVRGGNWIRAHVHDPAGQEVHYKIRT